MMQPDDLAQLAALMHVASPRQDANLPVQPGCPLEHLCLCCYVWIAKTSCPSQTLAAVPGTDADQALQDQ